MRSVLLRDPLGRISVRHKLALAFVGICLLAFGVGGYLVSSSAKSALVDEILRRLEFQCDTYTAELDASLHLLTRRIEDFASDGYIRDRLQRIAVADDSQRQRLHEDLRGHLRRNKLPLIPVFLDLVATTKDGRHRTAVRDSGSIEPAPALPVSRTVISAFLEPDAVDGFPTFELRTPVYGLQDKAVVGQLCARVHAGKWLNQALGRRSSSRQDEFLHVDLVDQASRRLAVPRDLLAGGLPEDSELVQSGFGLKLEPDSSVGVAPARWVASHGMFHRNFPIETSGWRLHLSLPTDLVLSPVSGLQSRFLAVGLGLAVLAGLLCFFPMRFIARPLVQMQDAAQRLRCGDFEARVPVSSNDEIGELAHSFNQMAGALHERTARLEQTAARLEERSSEWRRERDRLDAVIRSMTDGLVVLDADGEVVLSNEAAKPLLHQLGDESTPVASHHRCETEGRPGDCRACLMDPHGPMRSCLVDAAQQVYEVHSTGLSPDQTGRRGRVLLSREITHRIDQDEQQIHQERLAVLGEVAAVMAHELNNPLAAINMFSQMLLQELPEESPHRESAEVIQRNTQTCKKTIRELLDYATGACPEVSRVDVHETVQDVTRFLEPISRRSGIHIDWQLEADQPEVSGDEIQLRQIFVNLVMNALQAVGKQGGKVRIASGLDGDHLVVDVEDDGPGISDPHQGTIFEPFFTTKPRGEGTGLGLSTARRLAEMHGGGIELVHSRAGSTLFRVRLKRDPSPEAKERAWSR